MPTHVELGDSLRGEIISGNAMKVISPRPHKTRKGYQHTKFERGENAFCVIEVPLTKGKPTSPKDYLIAGEALKAEKIHGEAQDISEPVVLPRTGKHRGQFSTLKGDAFCIIEQPMTYVLQRKKS